MTKKEYLKMYKEDKLAEICERFEKDMNYYHDKWLQSESDFHKAQKKSNEYEEIWNNPERLFNKVNTLPANVFVKLYYMMQDLIQDDIKSVPVRHGSYYDSPITIAHN